MSVERSGKPNVEKATPQGRARPEMPGQIGNSLSVRTRHTITACNTIATGAASFVLTETLSSNHPSQPLVAVEAIMIAGNVAAAVMNEKPWRIVRSRNNGQ